jgi:hypothetical protein
MAPWGGFVAIAKDARITSGRKERRPVAGDETDIRNLSE